MSLPLLITSLSFSVNLGILPAVLSVRNDVSAGKIDWSNMAKEDLVVYSAQFDTLLSRIELPKDAVPCFDIYRKNPQHGV